jgi:hypothetical protein
MNEKCVKCRLAGIGSGYVEDARCSANARELPSSANGVEHFNLRSNKPNFKKCVMHQKIYNLQSGENSPNSKWPNNSKIESWQIETDKIREL